MSNEINLNHSYSLLLRQYHALEKQDSSSDSYQDLLNSCILLCDNIWENVNDLSLFSPNETKDDISTESLKFITIPGLWGYVLSQTKNERKLVIKSSMEKYEEFISIYKNYDLGPKLSQEENRDVKIANYKAEKYNSEKMHQLGKLIEKDHVDEEVKRDYYSHLIIYWYYKVCNELKFLKHELEFLKRAPIKADEKPKIPQETFKTFVITKEMAEKSVFGMGYRSLPTMTLDEFYDLNIKDNLPPPNNCQTKLKPGEARRIVPDTKKEEEDKKRLDDEKEDIFDEEERQKKIRWDQFKDENRKGSGNTYRRG